MLSVSSSKIVAKKFIDVRVVFKIHIIEFDFDYLTRKFLKLHDTLIVVDVEPVE